MGTKGKAKLKRVTAKIKTPFLDIQGDWEADENEQLAAWELYVELVTRIAVQELKPGEGMLREALSSLYQLFVETRHILKKYGPTVAIPKGQGNWSFGSIAVTVLNSSLRPVLAKWHPLLKNYEDRNIENRPAAEYELNWEHYEIIRQDLTELQQALKGYANLLAEAAEVTPL